MWRLTQVGRGERRQTRLARTQKRQRLCLVLGLVTRLACIQRLSISIEDGSLSRHASIRSCNFTNRVSAELWDSEDSEDENL